MYTPLHSLKQRYAFRAGRLLVLFLIGFCCALSALAQAPTIRTDRPDYLPGDVVIIEGDNWQPGEAVRLEIDHSTVSHGNTVLAATADASGHVYNDQFIIQPIHLGESFTLTATGQSSGLSASTTFTDGGAVLSSVTVGAASGPVTYGTSGTITFIITVTRSSTGNNETADLTVGALPTGVTAAFITPASSSINFGNGGNAVSSRQTTLTLQITTAAQAVTGQSFTVTATAVSPNSNRSSTGNFTISPKPITGSFTANNKTYDGTTAATVSARSLSGVMNSDAVSLTGGTAAFDTKAVGTSKSVTLTSATLTGAKASNYTLASVANATANIVALGLTVSATAVNKEYNGTTAASVTLNDNRISGDVLSVAYSSAVFADAAAGANKPVTVSGISLSGADAGNYSPNPLATTTADITPRPLAVTATAKTKVFGDADPAFTYSAPALLPGDVLSGSLSRAPGNDVGTYAIELGSLTNANYAITYTGALLTITPLPVSVMPTAGQSKPYGAPEPVFSFSNSAGLPAAGFTGSLSRSPGQNVGSYPFQLGNLSAGSNYSLSLAGSEVFSVVPAPATLALLNLTGQVYDGSPKTASYVTSPAGLSGVTVLYDGAAPAPTGAGSYAVTASLSNPNYTPAAASGTLVILPAPATLAFTAADLTQTYDGTAKVVGAMASPAVAGMLVAYRQNNNPVASAVQAGSYTVVATLTNPNYQLVDAGSGQPLVPAQLTASLVINKAAQQLVWAAPTSIVYGTALSGTQLNASRPVGDGALSYSPASGVVLPAGSHTLQVMAAETDNYLPGTASVSLSVTSRPLTPAVAAASKVYDNSTAATLSSRTLSGGVVGSDDVTLSGGTAAFADKHVGAAKTVTATGLILSGASAPNYNLTTTSATTTAAITALGITGAITAADKVYDATTAATLLTRTLTGVLGQDAVALTGGVASFSTKHVGTGKTVTASGLTLTGADAANYELASASLTTAANIAALDITGSFTAADKVYDNTTAATVGSRSLTGVLGGDEVSLSGGTASFATAQAGLNKAVTLAGASLLGADAGNYLLTALAPAAADITPRSITGSFTAADKVYDATTAATVLTRTPAGVLGTDDVTLSGGTASFADRHVGPAKAVTLSGATLSGAQAGNYSLLSVGPATAAITARPLLVTATAADKPYDGTTAASVTLSDNRLSGDVLTAAYTSALFADAAAGTNKLVTVAGLSLSGVDAANYAPNATALATASITPLALTISISANDKVYDGTSTAVVLASLGAGSGLLPGDAVTVSATNGQFASPAAGTGKTVTASVSKTGADAGNYTANTTATTTAAISPRPLTASLVGSVSKVYDGTTAALLAPANYALSGQVSGDDVQLNQPANGLYDTRQVGTGKTVTVNGVSLSGAAASNYSLAAPSLSAAVGSITARPLLVTATGSPKVYDGTTAASVSLSDNRISGDVLTAAYTSAAFASKQVGTGKPVTVSGISLSGADAGNYAANPSATTTASITALGITGTITADNKVYDGTVLAAATGSLSGPIAGDAVSAVVSGAQFNTPTVGTGKPVTAALALAGADAGNYTVNATATTTASITAKALTASLTAQNKVYDGTAAAVATATVPPADLISGDVVGVVVSNAAFTDALASSGKTVQASVALTGAAANNYSIAPTATTTAAITPRPISGAFTAASKVFDGTTAAAITARSLIGVLTPDAGQVSLTGGTASFASATVGTGKTVTASGMALSGPAAPNYSLTSVATTLADITVAVPGVTVAGGPVQYSDNVTLTATISSATVQSEVNSTGGTVQFLLKPASGAAVLLGTSAYPADWSVVAGRATVTRQFTITQAPDTYSVQAVFTPNTGNIGSATNLTAGTLAVTKEHADAVFTGETYYTLPSATASSFNILLSATVKDITALPASPRYDATPGNITYARVVFHKDNINGPIIGSAPVVLVSSTDPKTGTASVLYNCPISTVDQNNGGLSLTIYPEVSNYYTNVALDPTTVTLSLPGADFVTGGGFLVNTANSRGTLAGSTGAKTNFGFTMKYTRSGTNLKGQCNIIVRSNGRIYQIKSNAINTLSVGATANGTTPAYFNTKANYTDITDPLNPIPGGGNLDLTVWMNDVAAGGQGDEAGMQLLNGSQLLFASNWDGTKTVRQILGGGNVQVRNLLAAIASPTASATAQRPAGSPATPASVLAAAPPTVAAATLLEVFPNPMSGEQASVHFRSATGSKVQVLLYNEVGLQVATLYDAEAPRGQDLFLSFSRGNLPSGLYVCRLLVDGRVINYRFAIVQ